MTLLAQLWHTSPHHLDMSIFLKCANVYPSTEKCYFQRWSNIFWFDSDSNLFPRISNIRIRIWQFLSPNIIRIFESFSSNLEYLKHIFPLNFEFKLGIFRCPGDLLIPFAGTNGQDLCMDVTVTLYLYELFEYAFSIPAFCFLFSTLCPNITELFK